LQSDTGALLVDPTTKSVTVVPPPASIDDIKSMLGVGPRGIVKLVLRRGDACVYASAGDELYKNIPAKAKVTELNYRIYIGRLVVTGPENGDGTLSPCPLTPETVTKSDTLRLRFRKFNKRKTAALYKHIMSNTATYGSIEDARRDMDAEEAALAAKTGPCANPECDNRAACHRRCGGCKAGVFYCDRRCQAAAWPVHKLECHPRTGHTTMTFTIGSGAASHTGGVAHPTDDEFEAIARSMLDTTDFLSMSPDDMAKMVARCGGSVDVLSGIITDKIFNDLFGGVTQ